MLSVIGGIDGVQNVLVRHMQSGGQKRPLSTGGEELRENGDVWNGRAYLVRTRDGVCRSASRVLRNAEENRVGLGLRTNVGTNCESRVGIVVGTTVEREEREFVFGRTRSVGLCLDETACGHERKKKQYKIVHFDATTLKMHEYLTFQCMQCNSKDGGYAKSQSYCNRL